jgi:CheY-like chemotaxis protein
VIDRDPEVVKDLSALLMPELDVQSAVCPLSAALLLDRLEHVDLAFVELELPDFAGEQLLQQLGRWPDAIRVLLTQQSLDPAAGEQSMRSQTPRGQALRGQALRGQALRGQAPRGRALPGPSSRDPSLPGPSSRGPSSRDPSSRDPSSRDPSSRGPSLRGQAALAASELPRNAYLAHLVLSKPISAQVVRALQRATLGLLRI